MFLNLELIYVCINYYYLLNHEEENVQTRGSAATIIAMYVNIKVCNRGNVAKYTSITIKIFISPLYISKKNHLYG